MAYARFDTDSDVYVFRHIHDNNFHIHVAAFRVQIEENGAVRKSPIKSKNAGKLFTATTHSDALKVLRKLKKEGFMVQDYAFNRLEEEIRKKVAL